MALPAEPKETSVSKLGRHYDNGAGPALTALLTAIDPTFGAASAIGGLLSYAHSKRSGLKHEYLVRKIQEQLEEHEGDINNINENIHEVLSLTIQGLESAVTTEKIDRFAKIMSDHIIENCPWDETATALRAISSLEDIHMHILSNAWHYYSNEHNEAKFYILTPNFPRPGIIDGRSTVPSIDILESLGGRGHTEVRMFCMELMSKGLLHDNGQGSFDKGPVFTLTDAADWLLRKVENLSRDNS